MKRETIILVSVGVLAIVLAFTIPAIAFGMMGWKSGGTGEYRSVGDHGSVSMGRKAVTVGSGGMMGGMMEDHDDSRESRDEGGCPMVKGSEMRSEEVLIVGRVEESYHMMVEVEVEGGEVEVMVPHLWRVRLPNGETVEVTGWEFVEEYVKEGLTIKVTGYLVEAPMGCMMDEEEPHLVAYTIELPEQGISAELAG